MKLFVTGATGFIGSHFVATALDKGHDVVALRRSPLSHPCIPLRREPRWIDASLDMLNADSLQGCEAIVHLAAVGVSPRVATIDDLVRYNIHASTRLFTMAASIGVKRWIVAGSFAEYGTASEPYETIPANAALEPTSGYGASKAACSVLLRSLAIEKKASLTYLRLFSVFGDGQHESNLWPSLRAAAMAGSDFPMTLGAQVRDFVSVEAVAEKLLAACDPPEQPGLRFANVGTGEPKTVREFCEHWWHTWNAPGKLLLGAIPYRSNEVMRYVPNLDVVCSDY